MEYTIKQLFSANAEMVAAALANKEQFLSLINEAQDYHEAEALVKVALRGDAEQEILEATLEKFWSYRTTEEPFDFTIPDSGPFPRGFLKSLKQRHDHQNSWVHSLSHFIESLWVRRLDGWIRKFSEAALNGGGVMSFGCSDRIIEAYLKNALPSDRPEDFGFTEANMAIMRRALMDEPLRLVQDYVKSRLAELIPEIERRP